MPDEKNGKDKLIEQGMVGEVGLMRWLNEGQLAHLYLNQTKETYASLFNGHVKRPDFLVLLDSLGIIAVDAKNHTPYRDGYTLKYEKDIKKAVTFERVFRIPFWFAYMGPDETTWHWISALKAVEVGKLNKRDDDGEEFYWMKLKDFIEVKVSDDLGKLYIQRMPGYKKVKNFPVV